ncbi:MAG: class I SAM-dependent methyltransferase [Phycisphaerae bacterium]
MILRAMSFAFLRAVFAVRDVVRPRSRILGEVPIRESFCVLDFGCGPGGYIVPLARMVGSTGMVYALDANPLAVRHVIRRAQRRGLANVEAMISEGPIALPDRSLDVVLLYDVFHLLRDPAGVLRELHRVLKAEGFLSFSDHHMSHDAIVAGVTSGGLFRLSGKGRYTHTFAKGTP